MNTRRTDVSTKIILVVMCIGIWGVFLQNSGVIPMRQKVYVEGGFIDVAGNVEVDNTVDVSGSVNVAGVVDVENTVSVSIDEVLHPNGQKYYYNNN